MKPMSAMFDIEGTPPSREEIDGWTKEAEKAARRYRGFLNGTRMLLMAIAMVSVAYMASFAW